MSIPNGANLVKVSDDLYWDRRSTITKKRFPTLDDQNPYIERVEALAKRGMKFEYYHEFKTQLMVIKIPIPLQPGVLDYGRRSPTLTHIRAVSGKDDTGESFYIPIDTRNIMRWAINTLEAIIKGKSWPNGDDFPGYLVLECVVYPHDADLWKELRCLIYEMEYLGDLLTKQEVVFPYLHGICHKMDFSWNPTSFQVARIRNIGVAEGCFFQESLGHLDASLVFG
ncbi:hypothetical protein BO94DRAFT_587547 [Aspergillus sclerotioniger CBS 115572]|uniref:Uncharacterized protein n=1 Tax=Aspergillus sclerotioniger CBS 115572 TaxID=1450535 RepID=A0A317W2T7_9EURO|nr:hypothetical protein BO94DRAFT_587547 [Aspergillus sclerotioniger CBS 115572]PWY80803.1 hypothetical protein BO94DRAFT_587547 [Aspergillus sclerotioniger CBS 115572]